MKSVWIAHVQNSGGDNYYFAYKNKPSKETVIGDWAEMESIPLEEAIELDYVLDIVCVPLLKGDGK